MAGPGPALLASRHVLAGIAFEEHDLVQSLGDAYTAYRARVPALIPRIHTTTGMRRHD
jgi:protein-S-isoprenylcysteine O-methyltransferase Ste14